MLLLVLIEFISPGTLPQLDKFTYFTQFFWSCLFLFTLYILICNDGIHGISRIIKLRNQLVHLRENQPEPESGMEDIFIKGFFTGVSYMYSSLIEVSQWCNVDLLGRSKKTYGISCFGEITGSRGMERNIFYFLSKSFSLVAIDFIMPLPPIQDGKTNERMLIHVPHGQSIAEALNRPDRMC